MIPFPVGAVPEQDGAFAVVELGLAVVVFVDADDVQVQVATVC